MNITFIPGLTFDEQIAAWMNGTEDEHRMARWVRDKAVSERELDEAYGGGYDKGFEDGREEGRMGAEETFIEAANEIAARRKPQDG